MSDITYPRSKITALKFFLSEYPEHENGSEAIFDQIMENPDFLGQCMIWEPFEDKPYDWVRGQISALADTFDIEFAELENRIRREAK